ncbi:MAG: hypothetical protein Q7R89_03260 [bacterium]|nr:hypothetical protein [bacterium]
MVCYRKIKKETRKLRPFSYDQYTGKVVIDFLQPKHDVKELAAGVGVEDRQDALPKELAELEHQRRQLKFSSYDDSRGERISMSVPPFVVKIEIYPCIRVFFVSLRVFHRFFHT